MEHFKLVSKYQPTGDQPQAIEALGEGASGGQPVPDPAGSYGFREKHLRWQMS